MQGERREVVSAPDLSFAELERTPRSRVKTPDSLQARCRFYRRSCREEVLQLQKHTSREERSVSRFRRKRSSRFVSRLN